MYDRDDSAPALLSFLIGGIVGASLTCLLAPQSGIALRRRIREGAAGGARKGRSAARRLAGAGRAFAGTASEAVSGEGSAAVPEPGLPTDMGRGERG
jgi:gas vesicle protein